jgi:exo-beta-1,3-glucanase (GH17 family)
MPAIPKIAEAEGFAGILLGVWDPTDQDELRIASEAASSPVVLGIIVGNEGLMTHRYTVEALYKAMTDIRQNTGKPVSTTEVIEYFYTRRDLIEWSDFLAINAHPYFHGHRDAIRAVDWTVGAWRRIRRHVPDKPILFKEVGLPTAGGPENSEATQHDYYRRLLTTTDVVFAFFEAFDAKFKAGDLEQSWGIFRSDRTAKPASSVLVSDDACSGPIKRLWCDEP